MVILLRISEDQGALAINGAMEARAGDDATLLAYGNAGELAIARANHGSDGSFFPRRQNAVVTHMNWHGNHKVSPTP